MFHRGWPRLQLLAAMPPGWFLGTLRLTLFARPPDSQVPYFRNILPSLPYRIFTGATRLIIIRPRARACRRWAPLSRKSRQTGYPGAHTARYPRSDMPAFVRGSTFPKSGGSFISITSFLSLLTNEIYLY